MKRSRSPSHQQESEKSAGPKKRLKNSQRSCSTDEKAATKSIVPTVDFVQCVPRVEMVQKDVLSDKNSPMSVWYPTMVLNNQDELFMVGSHLSSNIIKCKCPLSSSTNSESNESNDNSNDNSNDHANSSKIENRTNTKLSVDYQTLPNSNYIDILNPAIVRRDAASLIRAFGNMMRQQQSGNSNSQSPTSNDNTSNNNSGSNDTTNDSSNTHNNNNNNNNNNGATIGNVGIVASVLRSIFVTGMGSVLDDMEIDEQRSKELEAIVDNEFSDLAEASRDALLNLCKANTNDDLAFSIRAATKSQLKSRKANKNNIMPYHKIYSFFDGNFNNLTYFGHTTMEDKFYSVYNINESNWIPIGLTKQSKQSQLSKKSEKQNNNDDSNDKSIINNKEQKFNNQMDKKCYVNEKFLQNENGFYVNHLDNDCMF